MSHLNALELRLSNERNYLAKAKNKGEKQLRQAWITQIEKEIKAEHQLLGLTEEVEQDLTDDELLAELGI